MNFSMNVTITDSVVFIQGMELVLGKAALLQV
jgi:hypothetical protein